MPPRSQHPAHFRHPHSVEQTEHENVRHPRLRKVKRQLASNEAKRAQRRKERKRVRAQKHAALVFPHGLEKILKQKRSQRIEAERLQAHAHVQREERKRTHVRHPSSPEYYKVWLRRLEGYARRRLSRGKSLSHGAASAARKAGINL